MFAIKLNTATLLAGAAVTGTVAGLSPLLVTPQRVTKLTAALHEAGVASGLSRKRLPHVGDRWSGCKAARAAGTAPLYAGEPGYRAELDDDGDGVACEGVPSRASSLRRRHGRHHWRFGRQAV